VCLLPFEWAAYETQGALPSDPQERAIAAALILGSSYRLLLPGVIAGLGLAGLGYPRAGMRISTLWSSGVLLWFGVDLGLVTVTGNHLSYYVSHIGQPQALRWGGDLSSVLSLFGSQLLPLLGSMLAV
jgi:hypothetical protein